METLLLIAVVSGMNLLCFAAGARIRQKVDRGEDLKIDSPAEVVQQREEKKRKDREREILEAQLQNIDIYDGTSKGQKEIPG